MSNMCVRARKPSDLYDYLNKRSYLVNFGIGFDEPKFGEENASSWFKRNCYIVNAKDGISMRFDGKFSVVFWAKFKQGAITDEVFGNRFILILNDGTKVECSIPSTVTVTDWNHYSIVRDSAGNIKMRINGVTQATGTSSERFDLTDNSYIYLGNNNMNSTGFDVIVDDVFVADVVAYAGDFSDLPEISQAYIQFAHIVFIVPSTGQVFGYVTET